MRTHLTIWPYSGYAAMFDPSAVRLTRHEEPDFETLEEGQRSGSVLFWPADEEELDVELFVDEPLPAELRAVARSSEEQRQLLRVPSGQLWLADPAHIREHGSFEEPSEESAVLVALPSAAFEAQLHLLEWPEPVFDEELRAGAGRVPVLLRDVLAVAATALGLVTVVGIPIVVANQWGDGGASNALRALAIAVVVLAPVWVALLATWRAPYLRRVDEVERSVRERHPAVAVVLRRRGLAGDVTPAP